MIGPQLNCSIIIQSTRFNKSADVIYLLKCILSLRNKKVCWCRKMSSNAVNERCNYCYEEHSENIERDDISNQIVMQENDNNLAKRNRKQSAFTDFCRSTSLHGWQHLSETHMGGSKSGGKYIWMLIIAASIGVASFFIFTSVDDFTSKYVVTNIDTTTASLHVSYIDRSVYIFLVIYIVVIYF